MTGQDHQREDSEGRLSVGWRAAARLVGIVGAGLTVGLLFITSILGAYHAPSPHGVPVAIVGPPAAVTQIRAALGKQAPGAFDLNQYQSLTLAIRAIEDRQVDAAVALPVSGARAPVTMPPRVRVVVASAIGADPAQSITAAFTGIAGATGAVAVVQDIAPLPSGDPLGVAPYFFAVALYMPSFMFGILMTYGARKASAASKILAVVAFAACLGAIEVGVVDGVIGALTGHAAGLFGVAMLTSLAFAAAVVGLGCVLGGAGIALSTLTFLVAGIPSSGGPFGVSYLPEFYRVVGPGLPLTNASAAIRNVSYFGGRATGAPLGVLAAWAGGGLVVLIGVLVAEHLKGQVRGGTRPRGLKPATPARPQTR